MPVAHHPDLELIRRIIGFQSAGNDVRVRLFDSRAREDLPVWSDIDIAVQASSPSFVDIFFHAV